MVMSNRTGFVESIAGSNEPEYAAAFAEVQKDARTGCSKKRGAGRLTGLARPVFYRGKVLCQTKSIPKPARCGPRTSR
jgi:hypothetical protein